MESNKRPDYHKRIRLDAGHYAQPGAVCSVTVAVKDRQPLFADPSQAALAINTLRAHAAKTGVTVFGFCIMPDHVHIVLSPSAGCGVIAFVGQYKNLVQRALWQGGSRGLLWQKSFWDHFLRSDEDLEQVVEYVLNNPVRRGLAEHWKEYGFSGSFAFDL